MKKLSNITLVRRVRDFAAQLKGFGRAATEHRQPAAKKAAKPRLLRMAAKKKFKAAGKSQSKFRALRVGVLDLGAWLGDLRSLLEELNRAQALVELFEIQAPVPGGLIKTSEGMLQWAAENGLYTGSMEPSAFEPQMIANEFFLAAEDIRKSFELTRVVGVTAAMIAGVDEDGVYSNYVTAGEEKVILLSVKDVRAFAEQADRPFAAAVGALLVGALFASINDKITYHPDTGCLFDDNQSRESLVETFKALRIDATCFSKLTPKQRVAADAMLSALRLMKRKSV
jgi:hypothetical protein